MRRKDREVVDEKQIEEIIRNCSVCRLGMLDVGKVYIVPLSFGYTLQDRELHLYFHSAGAGRKIDVLRQNPDVCFEMDSAGALIAGETACAYSMAYASVIGSGRVQFLEEMNRKEQALLCIMQHYTGQNKFSFTSAAMEHVCILQITTKDFTVKQHVYSQT